MPQGIPWVPDRLLSAALVGVSGWITHANGGFLFLFQSKLSSFIPWKQDAGWEAQKAWVYHKTRMRKTSATFTLDSLDLYILAIGEPAPHTSSWRTVSQLWDHYPRGGSLSEPLIDHLNFQVSLAHAHTVSSFMGPRRSYVGSRILSIYDWRCWQRWCSRDDKSIARVGVSSHMDDCCPVFNKRSLV